VIIISLGVLSCAPHQEPRFLLPLTVPLVLLYAKSFVSRIEGQKNDINDNDSKVNGGVNSTIQWSMMIIWVLVNVLLFIFFGRMHQGAVIPSLLDVPKLIRTQSGGSKPLLEAMVYFHTYMPPTFLLRRSLGGDVGTEIDIKSSCEMVENNNDDVCHNIDKIKSSPINVCNNIPLVDLKGSSTETLVSTIDSMLKCHHSNDEKDEYMYLIAPPVSLVNNEEVFVDTRKNHVNANSKNNESQCDFTSDSSCQSLWKKFQVATEDMPQWFELSNYIDDLRLDVYHVSCQKVKF
jgi:hypothetical protein